MAEPFLSEIRLVSFNFAPRGWAFANGQILPIQQNQALFALLGTSFGGDGVRTFQLPNLQGRVVLGQSNDYVVGEQGGETGHTLSLNEMPGHNHSLKTGSNMASANQMLPQGQAFNVPAVPARLGTLYSLSGGSVGGPIVATNGGGQPHDNMQPYLVMTYLIAMQGIFPPQS